MKEIVKKEDFVFPLTCSFADERNHQSCMRLFVVSSASKVYSVDEAFVQSSLILVAFA